MYENKIKLISEIFTFKYSSNVFTYCVLVLLTCFNRCFLATIPSWSLHRLEKHIKLITIARSTSQKLIYICGSTVSTCEHTRMFMVVALLWVLVNTQGFSRLCLYCEHLWTHKGFHVCISTVRTCGHTRVFMCVALLWALVNTQENKGLSSLWFSIILLMKSCLKVINFMAVK